MQQHVRIKPAETDIDGETPRVFPSRSLAKLLCFVPAAYLLAGVAYALFNFADYGADLVRFIRYIAAPGLIAAAFIAIPFFVTPRKGANIGLAGSATLVGLLLIEIVLNARLVLAMLGMVTTLNASESVENMRGMSGIPPTYTSKQLSIAMDVESLEQAVLGGIPGEEVLMCSQEGVPLYYEADRYGFNNPDAIYNSLIDVMLVGDSFVEGHCQLRPDTFAGRMRNFQPQTASIGMRGGGPLFELALIGRYGMEFQPEFVAMAFYEGNDWKNLEYEAQTPWLAEALSPDAQYGSASLSPEQLASAQQAIETWWGTDVSPGVVFARSSFFRNVVALNQVWRLMGIDYPRIAEDQPIYADVLREAKRVTGTWGGKFLLVYIPQGTRYRGLLEKSFAFDGMRDKVLDGAALHNIEVVDLTDVFAADDDPTRFFAVDGHFSADGSEVAARALQERIAALQSK